ncbi:MAG: hypothetical protein KC713_08650, partial [Candidatus Omnitrophica bacterium]|nr:hypothetical protein [Candidatus Omnitrophota bacterium]
EDFELLFTLPNRDAQKLSIGKKNKIKCFPIGEIVRSKQRISLKTSNGTVKAVPIKGFQHFEQRAG